MEKKIIIKIVNGDDTLIFREETLTFVEAEEALGRAERYCDKLNHIAINIIVDL